MRISKTVSITLPPDMLARAIRLAKDENRTMSELIREALRKYEFEKSLRRLQNSPSAKRMRTRMTEEELMDYLTALRRKERAKRPVNSRPKK